MEQPAKPNPHLPVVTAGGIHSWKGFRQGQFVGEIRHDARVSPPVFHYLVLRQGSNEIVVWAQEHTAEQAQRSLQATLRQLAGDQRHKA